MGKILLSLFTIFFLYFLFLYLVIKTCFVVVSFSATSQVLEGYFTLTPFFLPTHKSYPLPFPSFCFNSVYLSFNTHTHTCTLQHNTTHTHISISQAMCFSFEGEYSILYEMVFYFLQTEIYSQIHDSHTYTYSDMYKY